MYELASRLHQSEGAIVVTTEAEEDQLVDEEGMEGQAGQRKDEEEEVKKLLRVREESLLAALNALILSRHQYFLLVDPFHFFFLILCRITLM
jgi:hypothetical protein